MKGWPAAALLVVVLGCSKSSGRSPRDDAPNGRGDAAAPVALAPLALGMAELAGFAYRERAGHASFVDARAAEQRGDWAAVASACERALAADPDHLHAAYLLAVARAKQFAAGGALDAERARQIAAPLARAVAGDFAKWAHASLEQPALQPFLATPTGQAWRTRVEADRAAFAAALSRAFVVVARGDLYAYDPSDARVFRLTRTGGAVVAALPVRAAQRLAYVTRERATGPQPATTLGLGIVDLATGRARRPIPVPGANAIRLAYNQAKLARFVVRAGTRWWSVAEQPRLALEPAAARQAGYPPHLADMMWLDLERRAPVLRRLALDHVEADWDARTLASAIRFGTSKRVVTVPSPGLIDGNTAQWSPDRSQLAFVAQLRDDCAPGEPSAAAFVADAATGSVRELERAVAGLAIEWVAPRRLAIAGDRGVAIVELTAQESRAISGADGLAWPRKQPRCTEPEQPVIATQGEDDTADELTDGIGEAGSAGPPPP